ncbi:MAG: DUF5916 domain-containing protein, partial [Candidatus Aminicenantes bacterium]|nr:DUF5916 domain-containing protein [Candidatus Aminicenantes bacterium]
YDTEPEKIKTSITKRDNMFADDWVGLSLDSLGNKQNSYDLFVNPNGIQGDILNSAVGGEDVSPDFVWYSAGMLTDEGYQAEISIPLRSIRFKSGQEVNMGILFWRRISRLGISGSWPDIKPGYGLFNVHAAVVYRDLKSPLNLELLPSFTYGRNSDRENPGSWAETEVSHDIGMGIKYGITSSVTADLTLNPDFSQVESDAFQVEVNQRYPIFYTEKRPFFMEGVDILDFALIPHGNMYTAVHTRRIVDPNWGAKLTGTLGKTSFGILAAGDQWPGLAWDDEVNPFEGKTAHFTIARGKYSLGGENYIGGLYSGREFAGGYNRVVGGDVMYRFLKHHHASLSLMQSYSGELEGGPGTSGSAFNCFYRYFTKPLGILVTYERYGTDFRMDSAFFERIGISSGKIWIGPSFYPNPEKVSWLKRINPNFIAVYLHDFTTNMDDRFLSLSTEFNFTKQGYLEIGYILESESWVNQTFEQANFELNGGVQITNWLRLGGNFFRGDRIYYDPVNPYLGWGNSGGINFTFQPSVKLSQYFEFYHTDLYRSSDDQKIYEVNIFNTRTTYQFNKYLFARAIFQYNSYQQKLLTDLLGSFTFIPGTVIHLGYGSIYEKRDWQQNKWIYGLGNMLNMRRSLFFKASYLWRF